MDNLYEMIKKADAGDVEAQSKAAHHILHELDLGENDGEIIAKAFGYLRYAAMSASYYGFAALELGEEYYSGRYITKDYQQAVMWFRAAIQQGQPIGYYHLGKCFLYGHGVEQDYAKAFDTFLKGSLRGYINNSIKLGDMLKEGVFVDCDSEYAAKLYHHIFDTELDLYEKMDFWSDAYGQVCLRLGECYLHGKGVAKDINKANYFFEEAKEHADGVHWLNDENPSLLQLMYDAPYDETPDTPNDLIAIEEKSEADFISQMKQNLPGYNLHLSKYPMIFGKIGVCYAYGKGVERDYMAAYVNFAKCLLLDKGKAGKIYENLTIIYPHLKCFEHDQLFVDFCHRAGEKYKSDDYDRF